MPQRVVYLGPRQLVWIVLTVVFSATASVQAFLASSTGAPWAPWAAGALTLAAATCGVAAYRTRLRGSRSEPPADQPASDKHRHPEPDVPESRRR